MWSWRSSSWAGGRPRTMPCSRHEGSRSARFGSDGAHGCPRSFEGHGHLHSSRAAHEITLAHRGSLRAEGRVLLLLAAEEVGEHRVRYGVMTTHARLPTLAAAAIAAGS